MEAPSLTEDEMAEIKKDVLTRLRHYLCEKIRADRHLDFLRSRRILTRDDADDISCRTTQTKRTALLLDILAENPRGLDALVESIREMRSQNFIIAKITDEVQKAKNEKMESLRVGVSSSSCDSAAASPTSSSAPQCGSLSLHSTLLFHPDGERSPSSSDVAGSLALPSLQRSGESASPTGPSSSLPRPGDPGAPPLPDQVRLESPPSNLDAGTPGCSSTGGDSNFQPLRSRSLTPTSHKNIF